MPSAPICKSSFAAFAKAASSSQEPAETQIDEETEEENEIVFPAEVENRVQAMATMTFEQFIAQQAEEAGPGDRKETGSEGLGSSRLDCCHNRTLRQSDQSVQLRSKHR